MYEHSYRQIPMSFVNSPKTRRMNHFQFRFAMLCMMNSTERWQLPFEENALIRVADPYNVLRARNEQVADCRTLFLSADLGFFIRSRFRDEAGLVIAEEFRRDAAAKAGAQPQMALSLPDEFSVVPGSSGLRLDHDLKESEDPNQRTQVPARPAAMPTAKMNRSDAAGGESKTVNPKFQRSPEALLMSPVGKRLGMFLGRMQMAEECVYRGAYWQRIIEDDADILAELLDQGERCAHEMPEGKTRAKFLSKRLKERKAA
jgi:hypothetical protein